MPEQPAVQRFDVFMCHNSVDKPAVITLAERLEAAGVRPWLDEWELRPGLNWRKELERQIGEISTAAVFVGANGIGPWQDAEIGAFLDEFVERGCPVIPVLLEDAPEQPELPRFLKGKTWVDFRRERPEPFERLLWGITGQNPRRKNKAADETVEMTAPLITRRAISTAVSFEDRYLACQASDVQALRSEGAVQHDGIFVPLLRDVFVPLTLDLGASSPGFRALPIDDVSELGYSFSIWDFLAKAKAEKTFRQLAILAWGGYGKTTLLKHIAFRLGTKQPEKGVPQMVPFLLVLRKYRALLAQENPPSLPELIAEHHVPALAGAADLEVPADWARAVLTSGRALVMFDGFDEVAKAQRPAVGAWLTEQMRQYGESVFIVTSRPKAYKEQYAASRLVLASSLWVKDFDSKQRRNFVTRWYACQEKYANAGRETPDVKKRAAEFSQDLLGQIEQQPELKALARNPLLLNMIVTFHRRYQGANLPKRRVELYREICQLQLKDRPRARRLETLLTECEAQTILQRVAFEMMVQKLERVERTRLHELVSEALAEQEESLGAEAFLMPVVEVSELIVQQEDEYEFAHLSFQEYLSAAHVADNPDRVELLYDHLKEDWWKPTLLLYAGIVNPTRLIEESMARGTYDLAYELLKETRKRIDESLVDEVESMQTQASSSLQIIAQDESQEFQSIPQSFWDFSQILPISELEGKEKPEEIYLSQKLFWDFAQIFADESSTNLFDPVTDQNLASQNTIYVPLPDLPPLTDLDVVAEKDESSTNLSDPVTGQNLASQNTIYLPLPNWPPSTDLDIVAEKVNHARYADLDRYLKTGQWEKADDETYRLMITEVGKEEGQLFNLDDLLFFPCKPLKAIDELWVKHSDGRFGFSVQKEIYESFGGIADGKYHGNSYDQFCEFNGWKSGDNWQSVVFMISSPKGHLPLLVRQDERSGNLAVAAIFRRLGSCDHLTSIVSDSIAGVTFSFDSYGNLASDNRRNLLHGE